MKLHYNFKTQQAAHSNIEPPLLSGQKVRQQCLVTWTNTKKAPRKLQARSQSLQQQQTMPETTNVSLTLGELLLKVTLLLLESTVRDGCFEASFSKL